MRSTTLYIISFLCTSAAAFPRETAQHQPLSATTTAPPPPVTEAANLRCFQGSTVLFTTDCTLGTPVSYCHKPNAPIRCKPGFFPSVWHPDHCMEQPTCFPLNAAWLTTDCSNGAVPVTTKTLFDGTLAGGMSTVVSCTESSLSFPFLYHNTSNTEGTSHLTNTYPAVSCSCPSDQWYSVTTRDRKSGLDTFCMPYGVCPAGMTTSFGGSGLCTEGSEDSCVGVPVTTSFCRCKDPLQTPVYPDEPGAAATGCAY